MNSYPAELLVQLAPVMFVAGLDLPPALSTSPPNAPQSQGQSQSQSPPPTPTRHDSFTSLIVRLRDVLQSQRKVAIWAPERTKTFQTILVGREVRFPPRKLVAPEDPAYAATHSPLSPLTPSSPLYPDGLIAPIWIRKHTALLPSVFVLFLRLFEMPPIYSRSPLDPSDPDHEREKAEEERRRDAELSAVVAARKKTTSERGIKLTVVLLVSRKMLDDPSLDSRLTYIRRQSGLDSRAALFVLSPVSTSELNDFARSLQDALYEPALEYYTSHSKRVRRKRNRHSQAVSSYNPPLSPMGAASARPLRPEGWTVRYEYKMACFAEFRGEDEVALKHYQDAYTTLMIMFGSTAILPPRTKRWAEAKVLADAINVKISKLYLYNQEYSLALSHHNSHMRRFADFSRGWGIGEETFEYWSWMARQHRVLAELLEQGSQSSLTFPTNLPVSRTAIASPGIPVELDSARALGLNPSHALQHPGHYYYMAARCTESRRERFLASEGTSQGTSAAPGFANEKKVDHLSLVLELYTKSYEVFKKYNSATSQGRLTLWIAYRIARTYYESEKYDVAIRFFERIAKTYRREKWNNLLNPLLSTWYACAQKLGNVELMVTLLVEMIGYARDADESKALQEDLLAVLESSVPLSMGESVVVDLTESKPLLDTMLVFWAPEVRVGDEAAFQLSLAAPTDIDLSTLPIASVTITFSNGYHPVVLRHSPSIEDEATDNDIHLVKIGKVVREVENPEPEEIGADLRWGPGERLVVSGSISSTAPGPLTVVGINVVLAQSEWIIEMPHGLGVPHETSTLLPHWLTSIHPIQFLQLGRKDTSTVVVRHRPHELVISFSHQAPALLDEEYPIVIDVTNIDERHLDLSVDVLLQPTEVDEASQCIIFDGQRSSGLIKGIRFGIIAPGVSAAKTLHLVGSGAPGDRMIDISIQSSSVQASSTVEVDNNARKPRNSSSSNLHAAADTCEKLQTILIPISRALSVTYDVVYRRSENAMPALADLSTIEYDVWDDSYGGIAVIAARMECTAPCGLAIESLKLHRQDKPFMKVLDSSSDRGNDMFIDEYLLGDEFCDVTKIALSPREEQVLAEEQIPGPGDYEVVWRRILPGGGRGSLSSTRFALPTLTLPRDGLIALLDVPSTAKLHVPTRIELTVRNRHPFRSANVVVTLELDPSDAFIVAGLRTGRLPILLPGSEEKLSWNLIPVECGHVKVPHIKVMDVRHAAPPSQGTGIPGADAEVEGEAVKVVDVRTDWKSENVQGAGEKLVTTTRQSGTSTVLVLP